MYMLNTMECNDKYNDMDICRDSVFQVHVYS